MNLLDKGKQFFGLDKKNTVNREKENNMGKYQGNKNNLDYIKVTQAFNKIKNKKNANYDSLEANLSNFSKTFNNLSNYEKQEELKREKFQQLFKDITGLNNNKLKKIIDSMEDERELSDYEKLSKQVESITDKLNSIEEKIPNNQEQQYDMNDIGNTTDAISKIINESFWNKLKNSIQIPKLDLTSITKQIDSIKNDLKKSKSDINNSNKALSKKIDNIKFPTIPNFPKIPNDYLNKNNFADFELTINEKLKDLKEIKESSENLETVPAKVISIEKKIDDLSEKMDNLPSSNSSQTPTHIPKEEKSVIELAKYMTDGVAQFENIAKEYVSKISELEKLDKIKKEHQEELDEARKEEFGKGKETGKIELIKNLAENFPTEFKAIQSTFEDLLEEKFEKNEILEINDSNINEMLPFIKEKIENGKYKVVSPAILLNKEILFKANVENSSKKD